MLSMYINIPHTHRSGHMGIVACIYIISILIQNKLNYPITKEEIDVTPGAQS